ncbi:MAG: DUF4097 family beta strand repeat-containing protein [Peptococcaceae bacterium]|nr:DUF4097 family beta strand repeat-containing protein [Peptococcaceae bacterium]
METASRKIKVGSYTLALGLIAIGTGFLAHNLNLLEASMVLRLWPLLLIGLGVEYFIRKLTAKEIEIQFSAPSVILIGLIIALMAAANALYNFNPGRFLGGVFLDHVFDNNKYVREWQAEQPVALEKGARLEIENRLGDIEITASPDDRMHLSARIEGRGATRERARNIAEAERIHVDTGPVTRIYTGPESGFSGDNVLVSMRLAVPAGLNITANNKLGRILVRKSSAETLSLETSVGRIEINDFTGNVKAKSDLGEVSLKNIAGNTEVETSVGKIEILDPAGDVTATSRIGSIELRSGKPLDKKYLLKGENGQITFSLPRNSSLKVYAFNNHGSISGMESNRNSQGLNNWGELTLGEGKGSARLENKNGSVRVDVNG